MNLKRFAAASAVALSLFAVIPAAIGSASGGGGGGTVAGPCGTLTSAAVSPTVTLTATTGGYTASPLNVSGALKNCSIYLQRYWVDFSEPSRPASGGLNMPVVTCTTNYRLILNTYVSSGSSLGFSGSTSITPVPVTDPASCVGTHTVRVDLKSRTDGRLLSTLFVTYNVVKK
jgi:hypothetical protein